MIKKVLMHLPWRRERLLEAIARHVADVSVDGVCRRITLAIDQMSVCEARGYIRARAAAEVAQRAQQALAAFPRVPHAWQGAVVTLATERVAPLVLRKIASTTSRATERTTAARRRAA